MLANHLEKASDPVLAQSENIDCIISPPVQTGQDISKISNRPHAERFPLKQDDTVLLNRSSAAARLKKRGSYVEKAWSHGICQTKL